MELFLFLQQDCKDLHKNSMDAKIYIKTAWRKLFSDWPAIAKMPKIDTLDALEEHEEHEDDYQTNSNW